MDDLQFLGFLDEATAVVDRSPLFDPSLFKVCGVYDIECYDADGNLKWVDRAENSLTNVALDDVINVYLAGQTATATWYLGLVDNASFTGFSATDTSASHSGWIESSAYSGATRPAWGNGTSSGGAGSTTNASTVNYAMNATVTIRGLFAIANSTKGGTTGILFATAAFTGGNQVCNNGDTLKVTYTVTCTTS